MQLIINNLAITYDLTGKGKTLLLLHGWGDDHRTFNQFAASLSGSYQILAPDLPGFGGSQAPNEPWDLDNYANLVTALLTKLDLKPYAIIGHSNGGALAIRALSTGILKADKLVLLASAGVRNSQPLKRLATKSVAKVGKLTTFWMPLNARQNLRQKLYGTIGSDMLVVPELAETFKRTVRQDVQSDAKKLTLPTLIINADKDPAVQIVDGERFHSLIQDSKFEVISSNSHFIHQEQADNITKLILDFLNEA